MSYRKRILAFILGLSAGFTIGFFFIARSWAATGPSSAPSPASPQPKWLLSSFLSLSDRNPRRLLSIANQLFSDERLRITSVEPTLAFEWQHRLAMISALSQFFQGRSRIYREEARQIILKALIHDPSLLVRDGCVESVRRIIRMQPGESRLWKSSLEQAFLSPKNILGGEGFFIRETILTTLREASLQPSERVQRAASKDKNPEVQSLLKAWRTDAYDKL